MHPLVMYLSINTSTDLPKKKRGRCPGDGTPSLKKTGRTMSTDKGWEEIPSSQKHSTSWRQRLSQSNRHTRGSMPETHGRSNTGCGSERDYGGTLALGGNRRVGKANSSMVVFFNRTLALGRHLKMRGRWLPIIAYDFNRGRERVETGGSW